MFHPPPPHSHRGAQTATRRFLWQLSLSGFGLVVLVILVAADVGRVPAAELLCRYL